MGIVIINGKRYDSVTGLMLSNQVDQPLAMKATINDLPNWVTNCVDDHQVKRIRNTTKIATSGQDGPVTTDNLPRKIIAKRVHRSAAASRTLDRRFVKKPLAENGTYGESIAVKQIRQAAKAKQVAQPINIPEEAVSDAAAKTDQDFIPILTRRQAEQLSKLSQKTDVPVSNKTAVGLSDSAVTVPVTKLPDSSLPVNVKTPATRLTEPTNFVSEANDDVLNERLSQLGKILQNSKDLDQLDSSSNPDRHRAGRTTKASQKTAKHKRKFAMPAILATAGSMVAVIGIGVYIAMPTISVKMAASKAGIDAKNPYTPAGYTVDGKVAYQTGRVTINYRSNSGSDGYSVTQERSSDNEKAIQKEISEQNSGYYQEMTTGNQNVYLYRDKVTWLNNGMRYTINSNDYLDNSQISDIIKSL